MQRLDDLAALGRAGLGLIVRITAQLGGRYAGQFRQLGVLDVLALFEKISTLSSKLDGNVCF